MTDILVVGAGPAGAATAVHLAEAGYEVELLDRERFPRSKPCGEGLLPLGVAALEDLGVLAEVRERSQRLRALRFACGDVAAMSAFPDGQAALGIDRRILDQVLVERARRAGVHVREGVTVRSLAWTAAGSPSGVITDDGMLGARIIVGADGLGSRLRRQAGLDATPRRRHGRFAITAHIRHPGRAADTIDIIVRRDCELYVTPTGPESFNVAVLAPRAAIARLSAGGMAGFVDLVCRELGAPELSDTPMVAGPFPVAARRAYRGRLVLAGDAAGFFDGITGEGMSLALRNSSSCAEAIARALECGRTQPLAAYDRLLRRRARNSTLIARMMLFLARRPALARMALRNLAEAPATLEKVIAINAGTGEFSNLKPRDVTAFVDPRGLVTRGREGIEASG